MRYNKLMLKAANALKSLANIYRTALSLLILCLSFAIVGLSSFTPASASSFDYNVNVKPTLSITLSSPTIALRLNPASLKFNTGNVDISVATNNLSGYKLYMGADGDTTNLVNTTDSNYYIETLPTSGTTNCAIISGGTGGCTESNFPTNYWGYRIASGSNTNPDITDTTTGSNSRYFPYIPNTLINSTTSTTNNNTSTLTFAASADYAKPAGTYSLDLNFRTIPIVTQVYMQDMTAEQCTETPTIVIDKRDEHPYLVQRLKDNHCWMLDNLDLDLTNESIVANLTTENTNIDTTNDPNAIDYLKNGGGTASDKYAILGLEYHNWTGADMTPLSPNHSFSQPLVNRNGKCDPDKNTTAAYNLPCAGKWQGASYNNNTVIDTANANTKYNYGPGSYKIGTYYNYCAASAGTYCYGNNTSAGTPPENSSPTSDICPAGWHMPSDNGGNNGDYLTLCSTIKGSACQNVENTMSAIEATSMQYQLSTPLSGGYYNGTAFRQGTNGRFWSTSYRNSSNVWILTSSLAEVSPQNFHTRSIGKSVRCVAF